MTTSGKLGIWMFAHMVHIHLEFGGIPVLVVNNGINAIPVSFLVIPKYRFIL